MSDLISKFNLYALFRILLPGFYTVYLVYELFKDSFLKDAKSFEWSIQSLLIFVFSLLIGTLIYTLDFCRAFKNLIDKLPTNLMAKNHQQLYPKDNERENEHIYYEWYENSNLKSKTKTELQSGLYHLSGNFILITTIGIPITVFIYCNQGNSFHLISNGVLFFLSILATFSIVNFRLKYQWQRNYWEFEQEIILPLLETLKNQTTANNAPESKNMANITTTDIVHFKLEKSNYNKFLDNVPLISLVIFIMVGIAGYCYYKYNTNLQREIKAIELYRDYTLRVESNPQLIDTTYSFDSTNWTNNNYILFAHYALFISESLYRLVGDNDAWQKTLSDYMLYPHIYFYDYNSSIDDALHSSFRKFYSGVREKFYKDKNKN